jgi:hypothetical protein
MPLIVGRNHNVLHHKVVSYCCWAPECFLGCQTKLLELTLGKDASEFTIASIFEVHSQVLFQNHFKLFQVLKCMVCFVIAIHEKKCRCKFCDQWHHIPMLLKNTELIMNESIVDQKQICWSVVCWQGHSIGNA